MPHTHWTLVIAHITHTRKAANIRFELSCFRSVRSPTGLLWAGLHWDHALRLGGIKRIGNVWEGAHGAAPPTHLAAAAQLGGVTRAVAATASKQEYLKVVADVSSTS